ncbi:hypothetical protein MKW98_018189 [Papaver atlanticum]|uniref:Uncharacterized protein n=1 Tax=Papaver atlanticum TaxID=357466 RepID=A0AAD4RV48_9MAGN|nr:hypothetical protein MKW98_018189 [Papaver atlanticum]
MEFTEVIFSISVNKLELVSKKANGAQPSVLTTQPSICSVERSHNNTVIDAHEARCCEPKCCASKRSEAKCCEPKCCASKRSEVKCCASKRNVTKRCEPKPCASKRSEAKCCEPKHRELNCYEPKNCELIADAEAG